MDDPISNLHGRIGIRLAYYLEFEYTQAQAQAFEKCLGYSKPTFTKLLRGQKELSLSEIVKLAKWYQVTPEKIITCNF